MRKLAGEAHLETWPEQSLNLLAGLLVDAGDPDAAVTLLRHAQEHHPSDLWINYNLGLFLERVHPPRTDEAIRFYSVARALHPETAHRIDRSRARRFRTIC